MSDKPTTRPDWATAASKTTPSAGQKSTAFSKGDKMAAKHFNWLTGLLSDWVTWIDDGLFTRADLTDNSPVLGTTDRDGRVRSYLGPEGYWMGNTIQEQNRWGPVESASFVTTDTPVSTHMTASIDANTTVGISPGSDGGEVSADPQLEIRVTTAASSDRAVAFSTAGSSPPGVGDCPISDLDNVVAVMECRASWDTLPAANVQFGVGLHGMSAPAATAIDLAASNSMSLFVLDGDINGNLHARVGNRSAGTDVDLGITVAVDTLYTLRIEHHGANTPVGVDAGTAVNRFFVDGVLELESTSANIMAADNVGPCVYGASGVTNPAATHQMNVTTLKLAWNGSLDADAPA